MTSLSRLIRWASVRLAGKDTGALPTQQVAYLGKASDCVMVFPYGMHANVDGNALALMFAVGGDDDNKAAIPTSGNRREVLAPGEVMVYSPLTRSSVIFRAGGGIDVTAHGDLTATVGGAITAIASSATVRAPIIQFIGNMTITGNLFVSGGASVGGLSSTGLAGGTSLTGSVTVNGKTLDGHVHTDPQGGSTGPF